MMESRTERKEHMSVVVLVEGAAQGVAASGAVGGGEGGGTVGGEEGCVPRAVNLKESKCSRKGQRRVRGQGLVRCRGEWRVEKFYTAACLLYRKKSVPKGKAVPPGHASGRRQ